MFSSDHFRSLPLSPGLWTQAGPVDVDGDEKFGTQEVIDLAGAISAIHAESLQGIGVSATSQKFAGVEGSRRTGVLAIATGPDPFAGLVASQQTGSYAARFDGDGAVLGELTKSSGAFQIDHPLDPANKYLSPTRSSKAQTG